MALRLSRKHHAQLLEWAETAGKQECCGLLLGEEGTVAELELTRNIAVDSALHFEIDPAALISRHKAARNGCLSIMGCFHSHPNGLARPSPEDSRLAANDSQYWLIIAKGAITAWKPRSEVGQAVQFEPVALTVEG